MRKLLLALVTLPTFLFAQDITNTLGTGGKLEVKTSAGTPVEVLTVTDGSQVIISDVASPTAKTDVILDLNSTTKTLQLPMIDPSIWILETHGAGRIFWNTGGDGNLEVFYGPGITDFATVLNSRDGIRFLSDVQGNDNSTSIYIGLDAATGGNGGNGPKNGDQENVAFGHDALFNLGSANGAGTFAEENTAIGADAGYEVTTGRGNTALGYQAGVLTGGFGALNYTTAIGYGAKADTDNQIMLGRVSDQVVIPGKANIRDVLNLEPMAAPSSGEVGDIYFDSGTSKVMVCITAGTPGVWENLN